MEGESCKAISQRDVASLRASIKREFLRRGWKIISTSFGLACLALMLTGCATKGGWPCWTWQKNTDQKEELRAKLQTNSDLNVIMPPGFKQSSVAAPNLVILPPAGLTATVMPATSFILYASPDLMQPMSPITNGNGTVFVLGSMLPTNQPPRAQSLAWDLITDTNVAGVVLHYGTVSGQYNFTKVMPRNRTGIRTNITVSLPAGGWWYYAATTYNAAGGESMFSTEVAGQANQLPQNETHCFFAANVTNRLSITP